VLPKLRIVGRDLPTSATTRHQWGPAPFHFSDATNSTLAFELHEQVCDEQNDFPLPTPTARQIGQLEVEVATSNTWGREFALYVLSEKKIVEKIPYQSEVSFVVRLKGPGKYKFRLFHRSEDRTVAVDSAEVLVSAD
jgi:hypothetical protein